MGNKCQWKERVATNSVPNPAEFPLGSEASRAAARALADVKVEVSKEEQLIVRVMRADRELDGSRCCEILREAGYLQSNAAIVTVRLSEIPPGLSEGDLETYLREHGSELVGLGGAQTPDNVKAREF